MPTDPSPAAVHPLRVANVIAQIGFGLFAMMVCVPSMQEWGAHFGAAPATVQLTFSAYVLALGAFGVFYGPLSDRHGRRRILLIGLVLAAAGSVLAAFATAIDALIAARAVQGAGAAAGMVAGRAMVQDLFTGAQRTRVMAYVGMAMGLCPPAATIIGGQLHVRWGWQANFVLTAVLAGLLIGAAWRGLPAPAPRAAVQAHWLRGMALAYRRLLGERTFVLNALVLSLTVAAFYAFLAGAPLVLRSFGIGPDGVGWVIMVVPLSYIVGNYVTSRLVQRRGERGMMAAGQAFALAGLGLMLVFGLAGAKNAWAFALPLVLLGAGHGFLTPVCLSRAVGLVPALAGAAAAVASLMQQVVGAFGGYAVGWVSHDGQVNLALLMLVFTLCAAAVQWVMFRREE
jgi:DHA1 family bicyclomycin/chloramphenicol resistance-like MFS transporter